MIESVEGELARLLAAESVAERAAGMAELMAVDPPLVLWTICRARHWQDSPPQCVVELARWFAQNALQILQWNAEEEADVAAATKVLGRWRNLAVDSVAVANLAADAAEDDAAAASAFLLGLVHNAVDWLRSCGNKVLLSEANQSCLPAWLVTLLRDRSRSSRHAAVQLVLKAKGTWRESGRRLERVTATDLSEVRVLRRRWQNAVDGSAGQGCFLPSYACVLRRLHDLESQFQLTLEREKLAALGELAYGASHEINNPLANISTRAQNLLREEQDPERRRALAIINSQAFRANEMIADMMLFARPPQMQPERVNVAQLIDTVLEELALEASEQGTELRRISADHQLTVLADPTHLAMALRALCVNSLEALGAGGHVEVSAEIVDRQDEAGRQWLRLEVRDTGPGIPAEVRRHLFDPFYSGREAGRGLGLGLSKCWRVVDAHQGRIDVRSQPGKGTIFIVLLPHGP
jgi:signal transduction histidine kinase